MPDNSPSVNAIPDVHAKDDGITKKPKRVEPDKGWSWVVCAALTLLGVNIGAVFKLSGVFFVDFQELYNEGPTATAWIGFSLGICMTIMAPVGGHVSDVISHKSRRILLAVGVFIISSSVATASYMPTLTGAIIVYGVIVGTFLGILGAIGGAFLGIYFVKRRTVAFSIAFTGGAIGNLILPLLFTTTTEQYTFRGTLLFVAGIWLHCLLIPVTAWPVAAQVNTDIQTPSVEPHHDGEEVVTSNSNTDSGIDTDGNKVITNSKLAENATDCKIIEPAAPRDTSETSATRKKSNTPWKPFVNFFESYAATLKSTTVILTLLTVLSGSFAYNSGFFIIPLVALELGMSKVEYSVILTIVSVFEIVGKLLSGVLADFCGIPRVLIVMTSYAVFALAGLVVPLVSHPYALYAYGVVFGGFGTLIHSLGVPVIVDVTGDERKGKGTGLYTALFGLAAAITPVVHDAVRARFGTHFPSLYITMGVNIFGILTCLGATLGAKCKRHRAVAPQHEENNDGGNM